eukprot:TRINITY_DN5601_c0_g3_i4.p5 TRINITY_DN5601_c0_g3~~TRINITY_DN5601_c0_g3_i4.p5  ORF type:complete len:104 (+),score=0.50 TRINITY_DN5601_c0_g3_i4:1516-1827(+)
MLRSRNLVVPAESSFLNQLLFFLLVCTVQTNAMKPVLGRYYREPRPTRGFFPFHLVRTVKKSVKTDHYVSSEGSIIFYQQDKNFRSLRPFMPWAWGKKKALVA